MKRILHPFVSLALLLICLFCAASQVRRLNSRTSAATLSPADASTQAKVNEAYGRLPLSFEINRGQADPSIKFISRGANYNFSLTPTEATLQFRDVSANQPATVRMKPVNANLSPKIEGMDQLPGKSNYLIGADRRQWRTDIPNYAKVRYEKLWPGIDAVFYGNQQRFEYDFVIAPGADPRAIRLSFDGAKKISVDANGDLILRLAKGELRQSKPVVYQEERGEKRMVVGRYVVKGNQVRFEIGHYDMSRELVIDPTLNYLALGIPGARIAVDAQGNAYITSEAKKFVFPSINVEQDILVMKLNPEGTQVVYTTILGGSMIDAPADINVDAEGNVTLLVNSSSQDFPGLAPDFDLDVIKKSVDGAENFQPGGHGVFGTTLFGEFVFDPTQPGKLYASAFYSKICLYKSVDGGGSWAQIGQTLEDPVPLAVVPGSPAALYVKTKAGLMRSADGGKTWNETGVKQSYVVSLCYDPRNLMTLYAASFGAIFKSTDGGLNWTYAQNGLPISFIPVKLVIDQSNPDALYVLFSDRRGINQIYRSVDGGENWSFAVGSPGEVAPEKFVLSMAVDPRNSTLYFGTYSGLFKTADGGRTVQSLGLTNLSINSIAIDPMNSATIYVSTPVIDFAGGKGRSFGGIQKTTDGGANWTLLNNSLKDRFVGVISIDPAAPATLFAATNSDFFGQSVYAVRLSADGKKPVFSVLTALGEGAALECDVAGNIYVTGHGLLPKLRNALETNRFPGFVTKLDGQTREVEYGTQLAAYPRDLAVDRAGAIIIVGESIGKETDSLIKNGFQLSQKGGLDAFICRIDPGLAGNDSLLFGSYLGGQNVDSASIVSIDTNGMIYVAGRTSSTDFPTTPSTQIAGEGDYFLAKIDPSKSETPLLLWATRLGAAIVNGLAVDAAGNAYITGATSGGLFVTPGALQPQFAGGNCPIVSGCRCPLEFGACPARCVPGPTDSGICSDAFVAKISADGTAVLYSTYLGSVADQTIEVTNDIALDQAGNVYLTGHGKLTATEGAAQLGRLDGFVAKLTLSARRAAVTTVSAANYRGPQLAQESLAVSFLDAFGAGAENLQARVRDRTGTERDAAVFFSGSGQVNFQIPPGTAIGDATASITNNGAAIANGALQVVQVAPGVFTADSSGAGLASAVAQRQTPDGAVTFEAVIRFDPAQNKIVAVPINFGSEGDRVFLAIFGTGWRFRSSVSATKVTIDGIEVPALYVGAQPTFNGLDQLNVELPRTLAGKGEVDLKVTVDDKTANTTRVTFK